MDWIDFAAVPWWGVLLAFVATFLLGSLWYSPAVLYKPWSRLAGLSEEKMKEANMVSAFGQMIVGNAMSIVVLAVLMVGLGVTGVVDGLVLGAILGVTLRLGTHMIHNGFAVRPWQLTAIDGAHDTLALVIAGAIIGTFA